MLRRELFLIVLAFIVILVAGCGGGGGGGATVGTLNFNAVWSSGTGQSQLVTITSASGANVSTRVLNQATANSTSFDGIPAGDYRVDVALYSSGDAVGTKLGEIHTYLSIAGPTSFTTDTSGTPSTVVVSPQNSTMKALGSRQFLAYTKNTSGRALFVPSNALAWDVIGNATVNATGLVSATAQGTATVRATLSSVGISGQAIVNITPFEVQTSKWTVLVFMNAANDLYQFSDLNFDQMETVAGNSDMRFVVQWKQSRTAFPTSSFDGTRRYLVKADTQTGNHSDLIQDMGSGVDMGDPNTLRDFIQWGKTYFPAQRYCLIVWNHGNGWRRSAPTTDITRAVSYDDELGTSIQIWQLQQALGGQNFDIIAWDASLMQMIEVAYEIKDRTKFVVGSEESPPGEGYPYDRIFKTFRDTPDASTFELSNSFVTGMLAEPLYATRKITQSVIDTTKLAAVASALDNYGNALLSNVATIATQVQTARNTAQSYSPTLSRIYRDMIDTGDKLIGAGGISADVVNAKNSLALAVQAAVVHEGHNANSPGSTGLSFDFSSSAKFLTSSADYANLKLAQDTSWDEWLKAAP